MHGELMEFNEHLHKQLHVRDQQLARLKHELTELRGPVSKYAITNGIRKPVGLLIISLVQCAILD